MAYTTQAQIETALGGPAKLVELADLDGNGALDAQALADAQARCDGWIDGFLWQYGTPVADPSSTLQQIAIEETIYQLRWAKRMVSVEDREDRERRELTLKDMRDGKQRPDKPRPVATVNRAVFVENDGDVSREGTKGMW
jgi:phage gp36-like protein